MKPMPKKPWKISRTGNAEASQSADARLRDGLAQGAIVSPEENY
jgi:hypothetical protein